MRIVWLDLFFMMSIGGLLSFGQSTGEEEPETQNTRVKARPDPSKQGSKNKKIRYIVKKDTKGFLPGNKCYEDATRDMGLMYIALPKGQAMYKNEWNRNMHNLGVKLWLLFTRGPFWKLKVNKIYRDCRYPYGDATG
jgi:hypothetical protein